MKPTYLNELSSSFVLWIDHEILTKGEAFYNKTGQLYYTFDPTFKNYKIYGSQYRQWVCDSDVHGALIPSGIMSGNSFIQKSSDNVRVDYGMGRVIMKSATPTDLKNLSVGYSVKEFNVYLTSKSETNLLLEGAETIPQKIPKSVTGALNYKDEPYPAVFVNFTNGRNEPFAFGGLDQADWDVRCTVLSDSAYKLDAVCSILADTAHHFFARIPSSGIPFNIYGDFKNISGSYSYSQLCSQYKQNLVYIDQVTISKFGERVNKAIKDDLWGAFVDFRLLDLKN